MRFYKYEACGNDYVYFDCRRRAITACKLSEITVKVSDRHFGIGSDGAVFICSSDVADAGMRMFNADGSEGQTCGNALRCVAKYLSDYGGVEKNRITVETKSGIRGIDIVNGLFTVDMGRVSFDSSTFSRVSEAVETPFVFDRERIVTLVSAGNPHCVTFVPRTGTVSVGRIGRIMCRSDLFSDGANVEFVEILGRNEIKMRVYERGSGETLGCGSGACAAVAAAIKTGRIPGGEVIVGMRGGQVRVRAENERVFLIGGADEVFTGDIKIEV